MNDGTATTEFLKINRKSHPIDDPSTKLGDAETFNSWHTMPFFAKEVADDISFDNVVEKIKNNSNDEQKLFIHHLAEDELILQVQISNLIGMMNPRHILSLVVSRSKAPFEDNQFAFTQGMFTSQETQDLLLISQMMR